MRRHGHLGTTLTRSLIVLSGLAVAGVVAISVYGIVAGFDSQSGELLFGVAVTVGIWCGVLLASAAVISRRRFVALMLTSVLLATAGTAGICLASYFDVINAYMWNSSAEIVGISSILVMLCSLALAHNGVVFTWPLAPARARALRVLAAVGAWVFVVPIVLTLAAELSMPGLARWIARHGEQLVLGVSPTGGLVCVLGTLAVAIVAHTTKARAKGELVPATLRLRLGCPRCASVASVEPGWVRCASCRLWMVIDCQAPRCECGYLLYNLKADHCPECGRPARR